MTNNQNNDEPQTTPSEAHNPTSVEGSPKDIQPDAEPARVPTAPPTPDHETHNPASQLRAEIHRGGHDVSLVETDEEGLGVVTDPMDLDH